jgi:hypothetical protein
MYVPYFLHLVEPQAKMKKGRIRKMKATFGLSIISLLFDFFLY